MSSSSQMSSSRLRSHSSLKTQEIGVYTLIQFIPTIIKLFKLNNKLNIIQAQDLKTIPKFISSANLYHWDLCMWLTKPNIQTVYKSYVSHMRPPSKISKLDSIWPKLVSNLQLPISAPGAPAHGAGQNPVAGTSQFYTSWNVLCDGGN